MVCEMGTNPLLNDAQPGLEPATCKWQVRCPTNSETATPPPPQVMSWFQLRALKLKLNNFKTSDAVVRNL